MRTTVILDPDVEGALKASMGKEQYFGWDKALAVSDAIEEEEIARKMSSRK